jgi:2-polyprenyl-3-methyl-5-hydroxy-6-metoxy-1,4-benzoquinol methylase
MPHPDVPPCYLCASPRTHLVVANPEYSYVHCAACGYRRKDRLPTAEEEDRLYEDSYYTDRGIQVDLQSLSTLMRTLIEGRVGKVTELNGGPGRLLDVGAGTGLFIEASIRAGWEAAGVDTSAAAVRIAQRITRARVIRGGIEDVLESGFDAVTLWDVLEHLPDPRSSLVKVRGLLRPGGLVAISLPNVDGLKARLLGTRWRYFQREVGHISHFSPKTLVAVLGQAGFVPVYVRSAGLVNLGKPFGLSPEAVTEHHRVLSNIQAVADRAPGAFDLGENLVAYARSSEH